MNFAELNSRRQQLTKLAAVGTHQQETSDFSKSDKPWLDLFHASTVQNLKELSTKHSKLTYEPYVYAGYDPKDVAPYAMSWMHVKRTDKGIEILKEHADKLDLPASIYRIQEPEDEDGTTSAGPGVAITRSVPVLEEKKFPSVKHLLEHYKIPYTIQGSKEEHAKLAFERALFQVGI